MTYMVGVEKVAEGEGVVASDKGVDQSERIDSSCLGRIGASIRRAPSSSAGVTAQTGQPKLFDSILTYQIHESMNDAVVTGDSACSIGRVG